ncbi:MAG: hypothetical protein KBS75_09270 [Bacteroidales bacterium]|nr:hypothetical protein [Candidatus Equimonas faecalis]
MTREEALKHAKREQEAYRDKAQDRPFYKDVAEFWDIVVNALEKQNKEAEPVRHGHWIKNAEWQGWRCSECGQDDVYAFTLNWDGTADALQDYFCPHCGSRMEDSE